LSLRHNIEFAPDEYVLETINAVARCMELESIVAEVHQIAHELVKYEVSLSLLEQQISIEKIKQLTTQEPKMTEHFPVADETTTTDAKLAQRIEKIASQIEVLQLEHDFLQKKLALKLAKSK
jgi:hypothetical protein